MLTPAIVVLLVGSSVLATDFTTCPGGPDPVSVKVAYCEKQPCEFKRGENISADVEFIAAHDISSLKAWVQVDVLGVTMNYTIPGQNDACDWLIKGKCPLKEGDKANYFLQMPILSVYPMISLTLQMSLLDKVSQAGVACFRLNGKVV